MDRGDETLTFGVRHSESVTYVYLCVFPYFFPIVCYLLVFSHSVVSSSLRPHGRQHVRLPFPSPSPELKFMSIESVMPSNHLILSRPLFLLPSIFPSIRVFSNNMGYYTILNVVPYGIKQIFAGYPLYV